MSDEANSLEARAKRARREWNTADGRKFRKAEKREAVANARWDRRRRQQIDDGVAAPTPATKPRRVSRQITAVERGARRLLEPVEHYLYVDDVLVYMGGTTSSLRRIGPGRAATALTGIGEDERRAELVWAAAVLYMDFHAVYVAMKAAAPTRSKADELIDLWPHVDQRPVLAALRARGASWTQIRDALNALPRPVPPTELRDVLLLAHHIGGGGHLLALNSRALNLDDRERELLAGFSGEMRDLPPKVRKRFLDRREQQVHVRRVPALSRQRVGKTEQPGGTALADILFAGHCLSRRLSHVPNHPRRAVDLASDQQLRTLHSLGPQRAALAATGMMLDRSSGVVRRLVQQARVLGLTTREYTTS